MYFIILFHERRNQVLENLVCQSNPDVKWHSKDLITDLSNLKVVTPLNHKHLKNVYSTLVTVLCTHFTFYFLCPYLQTLENCVCVYKSVYFSQLEHNLKSALHLSSVSGNYCYSVGQLAWLQGWSITHAGFDLCLLKLNLISSCDVPLFAPLHFRGEHRPISQRVSPWRHWWLFLFFFLFYSLFLPRCFCHFTLYIFCFACFGLYYSC